MDNALALWTELGLPELSLTSPRQGYELSEWRDDNRHEVALALLGRYFETGVAHARPARPFEG